MEVAAAMLAHPMESIWPPYTISLRIGFESRLKNGFSPERDG